MSRLGWFLIGVIVILVLEGIAAAGIISQSHGWSAQEKPTAIEEWIAERAHDAALPKKASQQPNPVPDSPQMIADGRAHWADHCALCHGNDGSGDTEIGARLYPPATDMRSPHVQNMTDGELFFIIQNGVRMSGMPAWAGEHEEADSWKLVRFIRHIPNLTAGEIEEMKKLNPKGHDEDEHGEADHDHHH